MFPEGLNILFAGNIGVAQSFDTIIEAARILRNKIDIFNFIVFTIIRKKASI